MFFPFLNVQGLDIGELYPAWDMIASYFVIPRWVVIMQNVSPKLAHMLTLSQLSLAVDMAVAFIDALECMHKIERFFPRYAGSTKYVSDLWVDVKCYAEVWIFVYLFFVCNIGSESCQIIRSSCPPFLFSISILPLTYFHVALRKITFFLVCSFASF